MRNRQKRFMPTGLACLLLAVLLALAGCRAVPWEPALEVSGQGTDSLIQLKNIGTAEENAALEEYSRALSKALEDSGDGAVLRVAYAMEKKGGVLYIHHWLEGEEARIPLRDITRDAEGLHIPDLPDDALLQTEGFLNGAMTLARCGAAPEMYGEGEATEREMSRDMVALFENLAGRAIQPDPYPETAESLEYKKACWLEIPLSGEAYYLEGKEPVFPLYFTTAVELFVEKAEKEIYGRYGGAVSESEAMRLLRLFLTTSYGPQREWEELAAALAARTQTGRGSTTPLNRGALAESLVWIYEGVQGEIPRSEWSVKLEDTPKQAAKKAAGTGLMRAFPCERLFSPEYTLHMAELPALLRQFTQTVRQNWFTEKREMDAGYLSYAQLVAGIGRVDDYFAGRRAAALSHETVVNDRAYSWYASQYDTGKYADINCMPTNTYMGIKWYREDFDGTPETLREESGSTGGWPGRLVEEALQRHGVPFAVEEATKANLQKLLKNGGIALVQISQGDPKDEGHCMLIYGYDTYGETTEFIVHDPGYWGTDPATGEPEGQGRRIESDYAMFIIQNFVSHYIAIYPPEGE